MSSAGVQSWTLTAADNTTINGINIAENCPAANLNNAVRQAMSSVMQELVYQGADISASVSMSLAGVDYRFSAVTGSASIIHVGTGRAGLVRNVIWNSPSTLVNSANIICDGAANIVTATFDVTTFTSLGSGAWRAQHSPVAGPTIPNLAVTTAKLADNAVTFAKMQAITDGRLLGASGGTAVEEISVGPGLQLSSNVLSSTVTTNIVSSSPAAITTSSQDVFAHGLGSQPKNFGAYIVAGGTPELGYTAGDFVNVADFQNGASNARAVSVKADATNVTITWSSSAPFLLNISTFSTAAIDVTKWTVVLWAQA